MACQIPLLSTSAFAQTHEAADSPDLVPQQYAIPAGQLDRVLVAVATESRRPISFDAAITSNAQSNGVKGFLSVAQAIDMALQGTGFERVTASGGALTIRASATPVPVGVDQSDAVLPQITVRDSAQKADQFNAATSSSATRTDTPISDTPQSVQVITRDVMQSQQTQSLESVLSNVSNVTVSPSAVGQDTVQIRGFSAPVSTDGLMSNTFQNALSIPLIGLEQVDVLKGADSILAGQMQPGGVVNVIRKKPQADPVNEITMQTGSYGEFLTGFDSAGALTADKRLTYRFVVSGERTGETYGGSVGKRTLYVAPSVGYKTGTTDLVVGFTQNTQHLPIQPFTMIVNGSPARLSYPIGTAEDHLRINDSTLYYDFSQKLTPNWTFKSKASYDASVTSYYDNNATELNGNGLAYLYPVAGALRQRTLSLEESVQGKFKTGPVSHTVLTGFSYQRNLITNATGGDIAALTTGSIFSQVLPEVPIPASGFVSAVNDYSSQVFLQDQLSVMGRLHVLASIAHAQARNDYATGKEYTQGAWSPNIGVLYQLTGTIGVYANYLKSFTPQGTDFLSTGGTAPPSIGKSVEVGVKGNFLDDRLTASVDLFRSAVANMVVQTGPTITSNILIPGGTVSRGVEFDVSGQIMPGWNVIANYSYTAQASPVYAGSVSLLPRHGFRLWTTYAFHGDALQGWGVAGGIRGRSSYAGQKTGSLPAYRVPGQVSTDVNVSYRRKTWTMTFGVKNVFNHPWYGDTATNSFLAVYPGRTFLLTGTYAF
jgi:iron complex outermembrane receptor protein